MNLYEFECKLFFNNFNLVLNSFITKNFIFLKNFIYKIQVLSGSRKKNNGIMSFNLKNDCYLFFKKWLNNFYLNNIVKYILIEKIVNFEKEFYFSFFFINNILFFTFSDKGGIEIEIQKPIFFFKIKFQLFLLSFSIFDYLLNLNLNKNYINKLIKIFILISNLIFIKKIFFIEINPLIIFKNKIFFLDCKAIFIRNKILNFSNKISKLLNINYIELKGNICCIINGAGLALKTLDLFCYNNSNCLNFIDLSGSINNESLNKLIMYVVLNKKIKILFLNIFGGIVSCDKISNFILNITYYDFNFKILIKLDGVDKYNSIKKISKIKNIFIEKKLEDSVKKCILLSYVNK